MRHALKFTLLLIILSLALPAQAQERHCCLTWAAAHALGVSEQALWDQCDAIGCQYQVGAYCPSLWGVTMAARSLGVEADIIGERFDWRWVVTWAQEGTAAVVFWPDSLGDPDGLMHAYHCAAYSVEPPDYGALWCYDILHPTGRWWNAQLVRDSWSGWAARIAP